MSSENNSMHHNYFRQRGYVFVAVCLSVCLCVCLSVCKISPKTYERILMKSFGGVGVID